MICTLFHLGQTVATPGSLRILSECGINPAQLLDRHVSSDFGDLDAHDLRANVDAMADGERILSSYEVNGAKLWIITEADRSSTTLLLPEEY